MVYQQTEDFEGFHNFWHFHGFWLFWGGAAVEALDVAEGRA